MSPLSPVMKDVAQPSQSNASLGLLFPLSTAKADGPAYIGLNDWLHLPIDERAPIRSVAMVDLVGDRFSAVVIDTVADLPRWWIDEPRESIALLYEGMLGESGAPSRGTMIVSAPRSPAGAPLPLPLPLPGGAGGPGPAVDCASVLCQAFLPSDPGGGGVGGDDLRPFLRSLARLHSQVGRALRVAFGDDAATRFTFVSND
jgi:hypothetical protein